MHSSTLRGTDFEINLAGRSIPLDAYFSGYSTTKRLGVVAPNRFEATGAITLIMAHVTAFYACYRALSDDFFAYPDYFAFQTSEPLARYSMFDIWPDHKNVAVAADHKERLNAITDRGINILLVPEGQTTEREYDKVQLAAAERLIDSCYIYSADGSVQNPDLVLRTAKAPLADWAHAVFASVEGEQGLAAAEQWNGAHDDDQSLEQSFRRIDLQQALELL